MATPKTVAKWLRHLHHSGRSWRDISRCEFGCRVKFGTLQRIAKTNGNYFPKKGALPHILLGTPIPLPEKPKTRKSHIPRFGWLMSLPVHTITEMLKNREPMP